jgi:hypothetical protein
MDDTSHDSVTGRTARVSRRWVLTASALGVTAGLEDHGHDVAPVVLSHVRHHRPQLIAVKHHDPEYRARQAM